MILVLLDRPRTQILTLWGKTRVKQKSRSRREKKNQFERNGDKSSVASEPTLKVTLAPLSTRPLLENQTAAASARWSGGGPYVQ